LWLISVNHRGPSFINFGFQASAQFQALAGRFNPAEGYIFFKNESAGFKIRRPEQFLSFIPRQKRFFSSGKNFITINQRIFYKLTLFCHWTGCVLEPRGNGQDAGFQPGIHPESFESAFVEGDHDAKFFRLIYKNY
jgi:hypothetical protein